MIRIAELQAKENLIIGERISGKKKRRSDIPYDSDVCAVSELRCVM